MIKEAELLIEFWDKALEADTYIRNRINTRLEINGKRISLDKAFIGKTPLIDYI